MADYSMTSSSEAFGLQFDRRAGQIRVALPGIIRSFDPASQTVSAQPALKMKVNLGEGEIQQRDYPVIQNVPLVLPFAQGAGLLLTLPLKAGDECLLVFADRALDFFTQSGGIQAIETSASPDTTTPRSHHLTDAICIPGIISNPQAVPDYNAEHIELRDRERKQYFSLGPDGITITDGAAVWNMKDGQVTLNAPAGISYSTPQNMDVRSRNMDLGDDNRVLGDVLSTHGTFTDGHGVVLASHRHNEGAPPDQAAGGSTSSNNAAAWEKSFNETLESLDQEQLTETDRLLLCLPDIEENMAHRQDDAEDWLGWMHVRTMHFKWFSGPANDNADTNPDPYWVDWEWVMSFFRARWTYVQMTFPMDTDVPPTIVNYPARIQLGKILKREQYLTNERKEFDFISSEWKDWQDLYHQHGVVGRVGPAWDKDGFVADGLTVSMAYCTLRALARGWTEPRPAGGHRIRVTQVAIFVHDKFNFAGEDGWIGDDHLFYWDCEAKEFQLNPLSSGKLLANGDFRSFRNRHGIGNDFLVLSQPPHLVENFTPIEYIYA